MALKTTTSTSHLELLYIQEFWQEWYHFWLPVHLWRSQTFLVGQSDGSKKYDSYITPRVTVYEWVLTWAVSLLIGCWFLRSHTFRVRQCDGSKMYDSYIMPRVTVYERVLTWAVSLLIGCWFLKKAYFSRRPIWWLPNVRLLRHT